MPDRPRIEVAPHQAAYREGMSRLGAAVSLIATDGPAGRHGFTASAVCSVTDSPPTLLVCMNRGVSSHAAFRTNGQLSVNVLTGADEGLSALFADRTADMTRRFAAGAWIERVTGAPILAGARVAFDCRISEVAEVGTHSVLFCVVEDVHLGPAEADALIWLGRHYHRLTPPA